MPSSIGPPPSAAQPSGTGDTLPTDTVAVTTMSTPLGDVLADGRTGRTFYVFTGDGTDRPTCTGACARTWTPVTGSQIGVAAAIAYQPGEFKLVARPGGGARQLSIGGHPVYRYTGDRLAGQTNGQGAQGKWFVVGTDGQPITTTRR
jgi:predicted lipoprotein with Yx(FWY)xxD motif